jgi:IrrE N-terminal-like domain
VPTRHELGHRGMLKAREVVQRLQVRTVDEIVVEEVAALYDLFVVQGGIRGAQGRLVRHGAKGLVRVNPELQDESRRRFVIAHELGHHLMHAERVALCSDGDLVRYKPGNAETESNAFAAELLMPRSLFEPGCDVQHPSFAVVRQLARRFRTTLTATAIRFVDLCPEPCAVVWSESGGVQWAISAREAPTIRFGARLSTYSHAHDYFRGKALPTSPQEVPAHAWVERELDSDIWEDSVPIPALRSVLSLLWFRGFSND